MSAPRRVTTSAATVSVPRAVAEHIGEQTRIADCDAVVVDDMVTDPDEQPRARPQHREPDEQSRGDPVEDGGAAQPPGSKPGRTAGSTAGESDRDHQDAEGDQAEMVPALRQLPATT
jgi:hypothetical protein